MTSVLGDVDISVNELAWRLSGREREPGKNPPGSATRQAHEIRDHWVQKGEIEIVAGPRGAQLLRRKRNLATLPTPRRAQRARSGNLTSPSVRIEARAGGEVGRGSRRDPASRLGEVIPLGIGGFRAVLPTFEEGFGATSPSATQAPRPITETLE
jgi:hypothetical protein